MLLWICFSVGVCLEGSYAVRLSIYNDKRRGINIPASETESDTDSLSSQESDGYGKDSKEDPHPAQENFLAKQREQRNLNRRINFTDSNFNDSERTFREKIADISSRRFTVVGDLNHDTTTEQEQLKETLLTLDDIGEKPTQLWVEFFYQNELDLLTEAVKEDDPVKLEEARENFAKKKNNWKEYFNLSYFDLCVTAVKKGVSLHALDQIQYSVDAWMKGAQGQPLTPEGTISEEYGKQSKVRPLARYALYAHKRKFSAMPDPTRPLNQQTDTLDCTRRWFTRIFTTNRALSLKEFPRVYVIGGDGHMDDLREMLERFGVGSVTHLRPRSIAVNATVALAANKFKKPLATRQQRQETATDAGSVAVEDITVEDNNAGSVPPVSDNTVDENFMCWPFCTA
jgi:hypothetical protein